MPLDFVLKGVLVIAAGLAHNYGLKPPTGHTPEHAKAVYRGQYFERMVFIWALATRVVAMALSVFHILVMVDAEFPRQIPPPILELICPYPTQSIHTLRHLNVSFALGVSVMVLASLLRAWCFNTLGRLFTYRVAITSNHVLVQTGPYAYVRHPSYTGVFLMLPSAAVTYLLSPGNYVAECGIGLTPWRWLIIYWVVCCLYSVIALVKRGSVEDRMMEAAFGDEWRKYREKVPSAFVPYVA
ncbi:hypothetical protein B0H16DRAFT_1391764 [Mycena metata]|uniref:Protein-S-isoprenylcysteine O-methyltransferase n=1 Tax=Mycena metata TaxID=1033252 RepID=A0AAD7MDD3_9AGAR|nr:hypothetical protein B0H16DRAFT_1391764 [Mycena metata]